MKRHGHTRSGAAGDRHLLVEAGSAELDLTVRVWIHLLAEALREHRPTGVTEIVEGVRSLLVAVDTARLGPVELAEHAGGTRRLPGRPGRPSYCRPAR